MTFRLSRRSLVELKGVHPRLVAVVKRAITLTTVDFRVYDGLRTIEEQRHYLAIGATTTMNSRHLTGHAVDLVALDGGRASYHGPLYARIADAMFAAAKAEKVRLVWGGKWKFYDPQHFELDRKEYPA